MNMSSPLSSLKVSSFDVTDIFSPTSHPSPYIFGLVIPLCIIAFITRSLANHQRKRQSSLSLRYDSDSDSEVKQLPAVGEKAALKQQLSELRNVAAVRGNPVTGTPARPTHTANGKKIWENDEAYLACFPDLTRIAQDSSQEEVERMKRDKVLYWKLQNLEDHPGTFSGSAHRLYLPVLTSLCRFH